MLLQDEVNPAKIKAFTRALRTKLLDPKSEFGRAYLRILVNEIRMDGNQATISGSYAAMTQAVAEMKMGTKLAPTPILDWRPEHESNV